MQATEPDRQRRKIIIEDRRNLREAIRQRKYAFTGKEISVVGKTRGSLALDSMPSEVKKIIWIIPTM
ncbi:hypothetical protein MJ579_09315 [Klebsiella pneumoniae]|nr:hypothetical protein MJ579_09315 [Klebsiella pneumoniae]